MSDYYNNEFEKASNDIDASKKKKKGSGAAKKFFGTLGLAIVFGIVASIMFKGTNEIIDKLTSSKQNEAIVESEKKPEDTVTEEPKKIEETIEEEKEIMDVAPEKKEVQQTETVDNVSQQLNVTNVVSYAMPSIVAITNMSVQEIRSLYGMGIQEYQSESAGSGIIVGQNDTELLIVTNAHVVAGADTLTVCFIDDQAYEAKVKGADDANDLAVITVSLSDISGGTLEAIKIATIGDSSKLQIGEQVVAIGNAMGYGQSVTTGIVSALDRTIDGRNEGTAYIQTDAAINPGNSGGALLNMEGELVGINSAKLANTKIEGMGYAIPISAANSIMEDLMNMVTRNKVEPSEAGYLGISGFSVTDEVAAAYSIPKGIYVSEATEGTAASKAGIQKGDVILKFDNISMDSINKLRDRLDYYKAGEVVDVVIARADEGEYKEKTIKVTLDGRKGSPLDESIDNSKEEKQGNDSAPDGQGDNGGQRNGQFNFGGNTFQYSLPNNLFDFFK